VLAQVRALCETHPQVPKYLLVPRSQIGRAIEDAVARGRGGWGGVHGLIVRRYAEQVARPAMLESGRTEFPVGGRSFLAARLLQEQEEDEALGALPGYHQLATTVGDAIETLRLGGARRETVRERAESEGASLTFRLVAACYERYLETLDREDLYDDATVFQWAAERVRATAVPSAAQSVVAIVDTTDLPEAAYRFVEAVREACAAFYRIGDAQPEDAPPQTAADRFPEAERPPTSGRDGPTDKPARQTPGRAAVDTCRAVGATNEVKAVFRDIVEQDAPLDDVEIAVPSEQPYLSLIADRAEQVGVPVSIGMGRPAAQTRTGTALLSFFEWITEGFDPEVLIRMLRSGHLRIDRLRENAEDGEEGGSRDIPLRAHEVATLLAGRRYEPGREGYAKGLGHAIGRNEERIDDLKAKDLDPARTREEKEHLEWTLEVVRELLELVPRTASVQEMARRVRTFIERFGPVDAPPEEKPEAERTLDEAARSVLWKRVDRLTRLPFDLEASGTRLAALFRRWLERQRVRAEQPRPGAAHVVPLESAGFGGRSRLHVVGMDSDTLQTTEMEDALLRDADRRALNQSLEGVLPESTDAEGAAQWRHRQALRRHEGPLSLYARTFDVSSGEERFPSSLFLRLEATTGADDSGEGARVPTRLDGFLPRPDRVHLSSGEGWLAAYRDRETDVSGEPTAREVLRARFPWILDGETARQARRSDTYTAHDGLLPEGSFPELDFLRDDYAGPPMSAGRLEMFGETPYLYFLRYVLGIEPLDEPALDDEPWLSRLRRGTILHDTFEAFMDRLKKRGERPTLEHEPLLREVLGEKLGNETDKVAPPSTVVEESARRQLLQDALVFLRSEAEHCQKHEPLWFEVGFGYGPYRRKGKDLGDVSLSVDGQRVPLRGRIDRVDRRPDGALAIWDYKTGKSSSFDEDEPLKQGAQLQWALYAYALEELEGETVVRSGYYFTSTGEMATRLTFDPSRYRRDVERHIEALSGLARTGSFPMHPRARYLNAWKWRGYDRIFRSLKERSRQLKDKEVPDDRPVPPSFDT